MFEKGGIVLLNLLMIAVGFSMDASAVSMSNGMCAVRGNVPTKAALGSAWVWPIMFGVFRDLMPLDWLPWKAFPDLSPRIDHWVALFCLAFIGGKMVWEAIHPEEGRNEVSVPDHCNTGNRNQHWCSGCRRQLRTASDRDFLCKRHHRPSPPSFALYCSFFPW